VKNSQNAVGNPVKVGVLALQGNVESHRQAFNRLGCEVLEIRQPHHLSLIDRLVIPGGESTALLKLMAPWHFLEVIKNWDKPILGTCAGAILLAHQVEPHQPSLQLIDMTIKRNAYGRQIDSFVATGVVIDNNIEPLNLPMVFIRAPEITAVSDKATVLALFKDSPVLVQQGHYLAATFHPEMTEDDTVLSYFLSL
jgi:pyridoxal 5'-phosphate synthase pdxT subunit